MKGKERQGQEEIVGFVVVVVLVAVIALVVLGLALRHPSLQGNAESADIAHFLESVFAMTSECTLRGQYHASMGEVANACATDSKQKCAEGTEACAVLNRTLAAAIAAAWNVNNASAVQGYVLSITHRLSSTNERVLLTQEQGACKEGWYEGEHLQPVQGRRGTLITTLQLCFT